MDAQRPLSAAEEAVFKWAGMYVVLLGRCPDGTPDKRLMASMNEAESKELCAAALAILRRRINV